MNNNIFSKLICAGIHALEELNIENHYIVVALIPHAREDALREDDISTIYISIYSEESLHFARIDR